MGLPRSNLVKPKSPVAVVSPQPAPAIDVARESFRTKADSVEIEMGAPTSRMSPPQVSPATARGPLPSAPSTDELVERAAAMGPMRMTWESIVLPDPVLDEKRQPHVAERRARLTRVVKVALGACLGLCVLALGVSAISSGSESSSKAVASAEIGKSVPSKGIVPIEKMDGTKHAKAHRVAPVATVATAVVRTKRR